MTDARIIPDLLTADAVDFDAATIVVTEQRWEDNELLDTQQMSDLFEACHRLLSHIAAQEAVIQGLREACVLAERGFERVESAGEGRVYVDLLDVRRELLAALASPAARGTREGAGDDDTR